jgi:hypothetical protein
VLAPLQLESLNDISIVWTCVIARASVVETQPSGLASRAKREAGRAIRAQSLFWVAKLISELRRALRAPRGDRCAAGLS